jgi:hypothetical protein
MNKYRIISGVIILAAAVAAVVAWQHFDKVAQPAAALTSTANTPKVIAPARQIPPDVNANMQAALAAREKKLQALETAQTNNAKTQ